MSEYQLQPIETMYRGFRFRSRLEARWAVFLDAAEIPWQYEVEGYDLGGVKYLPDFWLPRDETFLEIKPYKPGAYHEFMGQVWPTLTRLADDSNREVYLIIGSPNSDDIKPPDSWGRTTNQALLDLHHTKALAARDCLSVSSAEGFRSGVLLDLCGMQRVPVSRTACSRTPTSHHTNGHRACSTQCKKRSARVSNMVRTAGLAHSISRRLRSG